MRVFEAEASESDEIEILNVPNGAHLRPELSLSLPYGLSRHSLLREWRNPATLPETPAQTHRAQSSPRDPKSLDEDGGFPVLNLKVFSYKELHLVILHGTKTSVFSSNFDSILSPIFFQKK
jgi:hypothetical protein